MRRRPHPPREHAARALCKLDGNLPDITMEGSPMWESYLPEVGAVLRAALGDDAWAKMVRQETGD